MDVGTAILGRMGWISHRDEIGRNDASALVDELIEGVLTVGAWLTPENLAGVGGHC